MSLRLGVQALIRRQRQQRPAMMAPQWRSQWRLLSSGPDEARKNMQNFQGLFEEARLCIEDCRESLESVYFNEDAEEATNAVEECVKAYDELLEGLDEEERGAVRRQNDLKVGQLRMELKAVMESAH